jgi:hypothetical protein
MAVLMVATPSWAVVTITCTPGTGADCNLVTVSWAVSSEPNKVRAFALDITVDSGAKIVSVSDPNAKYNIYPGSIVINTTTNPPTVTDYGTPVANPYDPCTLPGQTQPGLNSSGITIEMGSLYYPTGDNSPNAPLLSGKLLKFRVSKDCTVTVAENAIRGGVVLTNPNLDPAVTLTGCTVSCAVSDCLPNTVSYYNTWSAQNKPDCWCYPRQCYGDADGKKEGSAKTGYFWAHFQDLNVLLAAWNQKGTTTTYILAKPHICADFAHDVEGSAKTGYYRVHFSDLNKLLANWSVKDPLPPADCGGSLVPP